MEDSKTDSVNEVTQNQDTQIKDVCISNMKNVTLKILSWPNQFINNFHVEIILSLYGIGYLMPNTFVQNLVIEKICAEQYPAETCARGVQNSTIEEIIQQKAAQIILFMNVVRQLPAIALSLFMGTWSDIYGRKYAIMLPLLGNIVTSGLYLLNYLFQDWPAEYIIFAAIPSGLSGDFSGFMLGIFGYARDIHTMETIAMRISLLEGADSLSAPFGPLIGGQLFYHFGYPAVFVSCIALHVSAVALVCIIVNHRSHHRSAKWKTMIKDFFRLKAIAECIKSLTKKRDANKRAHIAAIIFTVSLNWFAFSGKTSLHCPPDTPFKDKLSLVDPN